MTISRSEPEMKELILGIARNDERIRAVIMNGSRANPNAPPDIFQDYDIVYVVTEVAPFKDDPHWIDQFGEMMILQRPDDMGSHRPGENDPYAFLMQFADGNRIDLTLFPIDRLDELGEDSLSILLLDKDNIIKPFPPPNERSYLPGQPTAKAYAETCNEFWWVSAYVAKGLWREEITYAKAMMNEVVREQMMMMLVWYIGVNTDFAVNPGKNGKYFKKFLPPDLWEMLLATYAGADYDETWNALEIMGRLFSRISRFVATHFSFEYPYQEEKNVTAFLEHVRGLPKDAERIY